MAAEVLRGGPRQSSSGPAVLCASRSPGQRRAAVDGVLLPPYGRTRPAAPAPPPAPGPRRCPPGDAYTVGPGWGHATAVTSHRCLRPCTVRAEPLLRRRGSGASEHGCSASPKMPSPSYFEPEQDPRGDSHSRCRLSAKTEVWWLAHYQGSTNSPETAGAGAGPRSHPPCTEFGVGGKKKEAKLQQCLREEEGSCGRKRGEAAALTPAAAAAKSRRAE